MMLLAGTAWLDVTHVTEAYGAGPPYYGRTANMDKWENPVPELLVIDLVIVVAVVVVFAPELLRRIFTSTSDR